MSINLDNLHVYARDRNWFTATDGVVLDILPLYDVHNQQGELLGRIRRDTHAAGAYHFIAILPSGMGRMFDTLQEAVEFLKQCKDARTLHPPETWNVYRVLELKAQGRDDGALPSGETWYEKLGTNALGT